MIEIQASNQSRRSVTALRAGEGRVVVSPVFPSVCDTHTHAHTAGPSHSVLNVHVSDWLEV